MRPWRVRRVEVPQPIAASFARSTANYAAAFAMTTTDAGRTRTSLEWAREAFEGAPSALRWCIVFGWMHLLRLKLELVPSHDRVLGWVIADGDLVAGSTALLAESSSLRACNIVSVEETTVTWVTLVHYSRATGRPLWAIARTLHPVIIRYLLERAARTLDDAVAPTARAA